MFAAINSFLTRALTNLTDVYWPFVSMLLHGDGTNAAQNNTFLDGSTNNFTVTRNGNTTQGSFNPFVSTYPYSVATNGGSGYFDGAGDYLTVLDNAAFTLGTNDFTIECWVNFSSFTNSPIFMGQGSAGFSTAWYSQISSTGVLTSSFTSSVPSNVTITSGASAVTINTWYHIAIVRNGTTGRQYVNGVQNGTASFTGFTVINSPDVVGVGAGGAYTGNPPTGYISNFRLVNGTCLYPSGTTFTPPTAPLTAVTNTALLLGMSNGAIYDNTMLNNLETAGDAQISTSVFKYGTGSLKFDGTGDYLSTPVKTALTFGAGDFTIECWVYANALGSYNAVFAQFPVNGGSASNSYTLETVGSNMEFYYCAGATLYGPTTLGTITTGVWIHYAICRSGNTLYPFKNGVLGTTVSITQTLNSPTAAVTVGGEVAGGGYWNGYIDDLRVTKGIARYTATFTPPTAAFPNLGPTYPSGTATQRAIFGFGFTGSRVSTTNLVSNTGIVAGDTTGVGTGREGLAAASYGGDKAIFGYGYVPSYSSLTNLVANNGVVATDTTGVGTARAYLAAAGYGTDKAIFGYGSTGSAVSLSNLVSNTGVVSTDTTGVGTARNALAATSYGSSGQAIFGYGTTGVNVSLTNLVSNAGVIATDTTGVGTIRSWLAAATYGTGLAVFGYGFAGGYLSMTNRVSSAGVVATDTTGVGTTRGFLAAAGYGGDKAIFGYGDNGGNVSMTNLVSNTGVVATDTTGVGTARSYLAAAGFSYS